MTTCSELGWFPGPNDCGLPTWFVLSFAITVLSCVGFGITWFVLWLRLRKEDQ